MDLFTDNQLARYCIHLATGTMCIIIKAEWYKGQLDYSVLIPQKNEKDQTIFCNATYSQNEIDLLDLWIED